MTDIVLETLISSQTALRESTRSVTAWYVGTTNVVDYAEDVTKAVRHAFEDLLS